MQTFGDRIVNFYLSMDRNWDLPSRFQLIDPFVNQEVVNIFTQFQNKYYNNNLPRRIVLGINPGRFGAGITGIPFTDPKILEDECNIPNSFDKKNELSAVFIYQVIKAFGSIARFYNSYYIGSVCPLGFTTNGINCNYYDNNALYNAVSPCIINALTAYIDIGIKSDAAYCIGQGKNYQFLTEINNKYQFFDTILTLPHPRWVMQYRRKELQKYIDLYIQTLNYTN